MAKEMIKKPAASKTAKDAPKTLAKKAAPPEPNSLRVLGWVSGVILLLDQITKYYVVHILQLDRIREIQVLPPWLNLHMAWNQGINFGLFRSSEDLVRLGLIALALLVCVVLYVWMRRTRPGWPSQLAAGLLIGGAIGNVIDRVYYGAVADFLNMSLPNWRNPYSFNVADIAIFAGAFGLILMPPQGGGADKDKTRDAPAKSG